MNDPAQLGGFEGSKRRMRGQIAAMMTLALMMGGGMTGDTGELRLPEPKPEGYGVHLSKAERKGKSFAELQAMRAARR